MEFPMIATMESKRLFTRELQKEDAKDLLAIYSDKEAMKYRGSKALESIAEAMAFINTKNDRQLRLGVILSETEKLLGSLLLVSNPLENSIEIGFSFGKKYWNKGYASETLHMVERHACKKHRLNKFQAWCIRENSASNRVFEKAGFTLQSQNQFPNSYLWVKTIQHL